MKFIRLVAIQFKQEFKDISSVVMMFLLPILIVVAIHFMGSNDDSSSTKIAVVNMDQGSMAGDLIETLEDEDNVIFYDDVVEAKKALEESEVGVVYVFDKTFSELIEKMEVPFIESYRYEASEDTVVNLYDQSIQNYINEEIRVTMYQQYGIDYQEVKEYRIIETNLINDTSTTVGDSTISIIMILYFMFMSNEGIAKSLFRLKETKVLRRLITTDNSHFSIVSSFILSKFLFQVSISTLAFIVTYLVVGYEDVHFVSFLLSSSLLSMVSISLSVLLSRIFKTESYISMVSIVITIVFFFAGFLLVIKDIFELPSFVEMIIQFSPFYWAYDLVMYQAYFPDVLILLLFVLVFTTAGSYKLERFIED